MDGGWIERVFEGDGEQLPRARFSIRGFLRVGCHLIVINDEIGGKVSVSMAHGKAHLIHSMRCAVGRIDLGACPVIVLQLLEVRHVSIADGRAIVEELRLCAFVKVEDKGGVRGGKGNVFSEDGHRQKKTKDNQQAASPPALPRREGAGARKER